MKLGLVGNPVSHSVSPAMQLAALESAGLSNWKYTALETPAPFLRARMNEIRRDYRGVNVTIPHKETVMPFLDEISEDAMAIGAVNTIVVEDGKLFGENTDGLGFISSLDEAGVSYRGKRILILGAGGAAKAISYALKKEGAQLGYFNRTPEKAKELAFRFGGVALSPELFLHALKNCDILINTTSVGLKSPTESPMPTGVLPRAATVVDIVYNPYVTKMMKDAQDSGLKTVGGLPMLVWQGALSFEMWTGKKADVKVMYAAAKKGLGV